MSKFATLCAGVFLALFVASQSATWGEERNVQLKSAGPKLPEAAQLVVLIRSALIALNNANATGNYTVLHALGATEFRTKNTPAVLALAFLKLRQAGFDLGPALLYQPKLVQFPKIDRDGRLRLSGYFETRPEQVNFDLTFTLERGRWRLLAIVASVANVEAALAKLGKSKKEGKAEKPERAKPAQRQTKKRVRKPSRKPDNIAKRSPEKKTKARSRESQRRAWQPKVSQP